MNSLSSGLEFVVTVAITFVVTPVLVHHLGASRYGVLALATTFVGFMAILDVGMGSALIRFITEHAARAETAAASRLLGAGVVFYAGIGSLGFAVALLVAGPLLPQLIDLSGARLGEARLALALSGIGFLVTMLSVPARSVPQALQRFGILAAVNIGLAILTAVLSVALVLSGQGVAAVTAANCIGAALGLAAYYVIFRRLWPGVSALPRWDPGALKSIVSFGALVFVGQVSAVVLFQLDRLVLGSLAGVTAVAYYVVPGLLAQRLHAASIKLTLVVFPASADLVARGERRALATLYVRASRLLVLVIGAAAIPLAIVAPRFLRFWLSPDFAAHSGSVLRVLLLTYFLIASTTVAYYTTLGFDRPAVSGWFYGAGAIANVILMLALIPPYGLMGAAVAYLVSALPLLGIIIVAERSLLAIGSAHWLRAATAIVPAWGAGAVVAAAVGPYTRNVVEVVLLVGTAGAITIAGYALLLAPADDRQALRSILVRPKVTSG